MSGVSYAGQIRKLPIVRIATWPLLPLHNVICHLQYWRGPILHGSQPDDFWRRMHGPFLNKHTVVHTRVLAIQFHSRSRLATLSSCQLSPSGWNTSTAQFPLPVDLSWWRGHSKELVVHRLRRFPSNRCHDFWTDRATRDSHP